ncbi:MAG: glnA, partial [Modestobacter sp.]|nr:glnA [Modestobacter sp.]
MFNNPDEVTAYIRDNDVKFVDVRFCDLPGVMQHFTIPAETFGPDTFADGLGFDGSSIRGFQAINESDMLLLPDASSAYLDPFRTYKTLNINFFIHDPITREAYSRDPRNVAKKAEAYLASSGIADTAYFGPEAEFYVFDSVRHSSSINEAYYHIDAVEGSWNSGSPTGENGGPNLGYKTRPKGGYFPVEPYDHQSDLRSTMMLNLAGAGLELERGHHE